MLSAPMKTRPISNIRNLPSLPHIDHWQVDVADRLIPPDHGRDDDTRKMAGKETSDRSMDIGASAESPSSEDGCGLK